MPFDVMTLAHT